ncbi:MAG: DUF1376 domain-containing protein [Pseudolabrys sp.]
MNTRRYWMPLRVDEFRVDTLDLEFDEIGIYVILLTLAWQREDAAIPNDMAWLKCALRMHGHRFNRIVPKLLQRFFKLDADNNWRNFIVDLERQKSSKTSAKAKQNSDKRWAEHRKNKALADAVAMPTTTTTTTTKKDSSTELRSDPATANDGKKEKGNSRKRPLTDFPSSWKPSVGSIAHGKKLGFSDKEIERSAGKFKGHHIAKGSKFANWDQAFNNWLDNDAEYQGRKPHDFSAKAVTFDSYPGAPEFQAWKTHYLDTNQQALVRLLNQRELEGRAYPFESQWPPGYQSPALKLVAGG